MHKLPGWISMRQCLIASEKVFFRVEPVLVRLKNFCSDLIGGI